MFNNASWEMLRTFQRESQFAELDEWGFNDMAGGLCGAGARVHTRAELDALHRFVAAVKRLNAKA